jgi:catechol 2,3-dioxygenase-like lactoylglutathione lyase family enzyme
VTGFLPMLFVTDVEATSRWYQQLFGLHSGHGGPEFEMLVATEGGHDVVLQLHKADLDEHGKRIIPGAPNGLGVILEYEVSDIDGVHDHHRRAVDMGATVEVEPWFNELAHHTEFTLLDPDGYAISVHSPFQP